MYTLNTLPYVISEGLCSYQLLRETPQWEHFSESDMQQHFLNVHALFSDRIEALKNEHSYLTSQAEQELQFIFETLLQAKKHLQDRE